MRKVLKKGHIAKVYIENRNVYKTYDATYPDEWVDKEVYINRLLRENTKLNVVKMEKIAPYEIKMPYIGNKHLNMNDKQENSHAFLSLFVKLQTEIYQYSDLELENAHVLYKRWISLSNLIEPVKQKALSALNQIEKQNQLCHFDYQPSHIISYENKYFIIDWIRAKLANPILDIANTYLNFFIHQVAYAKTYLDEVYQQYTYQRNDFNHALLVVAAIKLLDTIDTDTQSRLRAIILSK